MTEYRTQNPKKYVNLLGDDVEVQLRVCWTKLKVGQEQATNDQLPWIGNDDADDDDVRS